MACMFRPAELYYRQTTIYDLSTQMIADNYLALSFERGVMHDKKVFGVAVS
jgi:hypothetical protein